MPAICSVCGGTSHDLEFCDHCNADLTAPPVTEPPQRCPLVPGGIELSSAQVRQLSRPEGAAQIAAGNQLWRVHWISQAAWERLRSGVEQRLSISTPALPPGRILPDFSGVWLLCETSGCRAEPWSRPAGADGLTQVRRLVDFIHALAQTLQDLHEQGLVWLTFDPEEIEEIPGNRLRITNLDLGVYPAGQCPDRLQIQPAFAAPEIGHLLGKAIGPATDVYHLALYAYYWLAGLLPRGFNGAGLETFLFALPPLRIFAPNLPTGIAGVLTRALTIDPGQRLARPADFAGELRNALERAEQRWASTIPVHWDIGQHSRGGQAKTAQGRPNEDKALVQVFQEPPRALVAVADGITTCDVGSGALASLLTCLVLENTFGAHTNQASFVEEIPRACRQSASRLLTWALEKGYRQQLQAGRDLMGTTLTAGWLEGTRLTLANLGDSRAYLLNGDLVEQLTVDGDLGSGLLASGVPPEEVHDLGGMAKSLQNCIGGCVAMPDGEPQILEEHCQPRLSTWPLCPGDVVVLCSDGLVEEGVFLEPQAMANIIRQHSSQSAQTLADLLGEAADALQRLPTPLEPEGFGDNITCIVIKIQ